MTPTLGMGGAEKIALCQVRALAKKAGPLTLLTTHKGQDFLTPPPEVNRVALNLPARRGFFAVPGSRTLRIVAALKKLKPKLAIVNMDVSAALACYAAGVKYIFVEHSDLPDTKIDFLKKRAFKKAVAVVLVSEESENYLKKLLPRVKTRVIKNPVIKPTLKKNEKPFFAAPKNNVLAVGRFVKQKGFDTLLEAWALLEKNFPQWQLNIVGDGPQRELLESKIASLNLKNVCLPGAVQDMAPVYEYTDIFVVPSRWETFCLALGEAMAFGTACVAFNCSGPAALMRHGFDGLLVEKGNVKALAHAIRTLMTDDEMRNSMAANSREVTARFGFQQFADEYLNLVQQFL